MRNGSYRNHCPFCLYSIHIDHHPGDRSHTCLELMKPIEIKLNSKKGMQIIHQCLGCGERKANKVAEGDPQSDDINELINIMAR